MLRQQHTSQRSGKGVGGKGPAAQGVLGGSPTLIARASMSVPIGIQLRKRVREDRKVNEQATAEPALSHL